MEAFSGYNPDSAVVYKANGIPPVESCEFAFLHISEVKALSMRKGISSPGEVKVDSRGNLLAAETPDFFSVIWLPRNGYLILFLADPVGSTGEAGVIFARKLTEQFYEDVLRGVLKWQVGHEHEALEAWLRSKDVKQSPGGTSTVLTALVNDRQEWFFAGVGDPAAYVSEADIGKTYNLLTSEQALQYRGITPQKVRIPHQLGSGDAAIFSFPSSFGGGARLSEIILISDIGHKIEVPTKYIMRSISYPFLLAKICSGFDDVAFISVRLT